MKNVWATQATTLKGEIERETLEKKTYGGGTRKKLNRGRRNQRTRAGYSTKSQDRTRSY